MASNVISRSDALLAGLDRYYTGKPCIHGHVCERRTSSKHCLECRRVGVKKSKRTLAGKQRRARQQIKYKTTPNGKLTQHKATMKWRKNNPEAQKNNEHAQRARRRGADGRYTPQDIDKLLIKQHNRCSGCYISFNVVKHTVDHIIPLARGGSNWPSNLQLLCSPCNDSKGAKFMCDWAPPVREVSWAIH